MAARNDQAARTNYKNWMKGEGLRPFDPGEKPNRPEEPNQAHITNELMKMRQKRHRMEVR